MYLRLKNKGDRTQFKIAQSPVYSGKHFMQDGANWDVVECSRINSQEECITCENYFALMAESKKLKESDKKESERIANEARKSKVTVIFYFPILNRDTGEFAILQTTEGVRNRLNAKHEAGIDVMEKEWLLVNTGSEVPTERYSLDPVDSAEVKPLTPEEEAEFKKAQEYDITSINEGGNVSDEIIEP